MGSKLIQPLKRGANGNRLTPNQRLFVEELLADEQFNPTRAARAAGYKNPAIMGNKLIKLPVIRAMIGKALQERIERTQLRADDVLEMLTTALFLDPAELFSVTGDGVILVKSLDEIPQKLRRCITRLKCRTRYDKKGEAQESLMEVELMSKDTMLQLAMKHLGLGGTEKVDVQIQGNVVLELLQAAEQERRATVIDTKFIEAKIEDQSAGPIIE